MASFEDLAFDWSTLCQDCPECWTTSVLALFLASAAQFATACHNRKPVCGTDYVTYSNICAFHIAKYRHPYLEVLQFGRCTHQRPHLLYSIYQDSRYDLDYHTTPRPENNYHIFAPVDYNPWPPANNGPPGYNDNWAPGYDNNKPPENNNQQRPTDHKPQIDNTPQLNDDIDKLYEDTEFLPEAVPNGPKFTTESDTNISIENIAENANEVNVEGSEEVVNFENTGTNENTINVDKNKNLKISSEAKNKNVININTKKKNRHNKKTEFLY